MAGKRKSSAAEVLPETEPRLEQKGNGHGQAGQGDSQAGKSNGQGETSLRSAGAPIPLAAMSQSRSSADLEDRIRQRAYEIYEARGREDGRADEDWLLAEEEITGITGGG